MRSASTRWTNQSVLAFAQGSDPIQEIERQTRSLVLYAIEQGWSGPPFDPIRLADIMKIEVVPRDDIRDARTVSVGSKNARIEFNPNRSRGRVRFSIAHEIVHTLFPDYAQRVRNREAHTAATGDGWQLEMLCNIGASEIIMPIGSFRELEESSLTIENLMEERKRHDVSVEAVMIRAAKLTRHACAMFCASRVEDGQNKGRYRLDYIIGSSTWTNALSPAKYIPQNSVISECTAIGYTAKGEEAWAAGSRPISVECVGIPPYPGANYPRVAGLLRVLTSKAEPEAPRITYLRGDALSPRGEGNKIIAHVVNDKTANWGGAGFAVAVRRKWPAAQDDFRSWAHADPRNLGLGRVHVFQVDPETQLVSMVAQKGFGPSPKPRVRYASLENCLRELALIALRRDAEIHMPRIGAGHAGGAWPIIEELIVEILLRQGLRVTVYDLPARAPAIATDGFLAGVLQ